MTDDIFDNIETAEDVGLVIPVPDPDTVLFVLREGDRYAYMPVTREYLEDPQTSYDAVQAVLNHCDRYLAQLEQHGKARNANGEPTGPGRHGREPGSSIRLSPQNRYL